MKPTRKLLRVLEQSGARVEKRRSGHWRVYKPGHQPVFFASTPGDYHAYKNMLATLRREGYITNEDQT